MDALLKDIRYAIRMLRKRPLITAVACLSLALGIGANTTIFSLMNALFLQSLAVKDAPRLLSIYTADARNQGLNPLSHLNWKDYREQNRVFEGIAGYDWTPVSVVIDGSEPAVVFSQMVSGNYFQVLGVEAALGRNFGPEEDAALGAHPVAVLSHRFWQERLGGSRAAIGRKLLINDIPFDAIGVAPASFTGLDVGVEPDLWLPMAMNRQLKPSFNWYETRRGLFIGAFGRLAPGVTPERAAAEMRTIAARLEQEYPDDNADRSVALRPISRWSTAPQAREGALGATGMLMVVVALVLLIACVNVANLLLARATGRRKEIAVRLALGAGRWRLLRQLLTESTLLALLGAAAGLLVADWARSVLVGFLPSLPFPVTVALNLELDMRVLAFTTGLAILTGVVAGLAPALQASRPQLVDALKERGQAEIRGHRLLSGRNALVGLQVALSLVALLGAGLFVKSLRAASHIDPGYPVERLLVLSFDTGLRGYSEERALQFVRDVQERIRALPGIESATLAQAGPFQGSFLRSVFPEGQEGETRGTFVQVNVVVPGYFETLGIPILRGRGFEPGDVEGGNRVVVVNETMAEKYWPGEEAIGKRFRFHGDEQLALVAGIAKRVDYGAVGEDPQPLAYEVLEQRHVTSLTLIARASGDAGPALLRAQQQLREMDRDLALVRPATVERLLQDSLWAPRLGATLLGIFGLLALVLAAIGIYGVMAYSVGQRSQEIGIRTALGASRGRVMRMVLRQGMSVVGAGVCLGLLLAAGLSRLVQSMLFISATDTAVWSATALLLLAVGMLANWWPALRATHVDPVIALRSE